MRAGEDELTAQPSTLRAVQPGCWYRWRQALREHSGTYLTWRHAGDLASASARYTAQRIRWQAHTVVKRCENIKDRYVRLGAPGLRGPNAWSSSRCCSSPPASCRPPTCSSCPARALPG